MELDRNLFFSEAAERLDAVLLDHARLVMESDELGALNNLFQLLDGYASYMRHNLTEVGFDEDEAENQAWQATWNRLHSVVEASNGDFTSELAVYTERNLSTVYPDQQVSDFGEPLDAVTRNFYRTFVGCIEHPAVKPTASWLYE